MWKFSYGLNVTIHGIFIVFQSEKSSKWSQFLYFCQAFLPLMSLIQPVLAQELTQIARKSRKLRVILPDLIQKRYAYFQRSRFSNAMRRWLHYQSCRLHRRLWCWCHWLYPEKVFKYDPICCQIRDLSSQTLIWKPFQEMLQRRNCMRRFLSLPCRLSSRTGPPDIIID